MTIDLKQLRALAEAASQPSSWASVVQDGNATVVDAHGMWVADCGAAPDDAAFIAAANPQAVIALLDELAESERHRKSAEGKLDIVLEENKRVQAEFTTAHRTWIAERDQLRRELEEVRAANERLRGDLLLSGGPVDEAVVITTTDAATEAAAAVTERDSARAEVERMRPVYEAAIKAIDNADRDRCAIWLDSTTGHALDRAACDAAAAAPQPDDPNRCAVCGWPLAESVDKGCVRGNCSQRPRPERLYAPERAAREATAPGGDRE